MPKVMKEIVVAEQTAPATPPANFAVLYALADGRFYSKDDAGNVYPVSDALDEALYWLVI